MAGLLCVLLLRVQPLLRVLLRLGRNRELPLLWRNVLRLLRILCLPLMRLWRRYVLRLLGRILWRLLRLWRRHILPPLLLRGELRIHPLRRRYLLSQGRSAARAKNDAVLNLHPAVLTKISHCLSSFRLQ